MADKSEKCEKCGQELRQCLMCKQELLKESEKYPYQRYFLVFVFSLEIILLICFIPFTWFSAIPFDKYLFGIFAGILGLFLRNLFWLFGNKKESKGKKFTLIPTYFFQYQIFIILSSILISSVLILNDTIKNSTYLFFTFALPVNIYVGLATYEALDFLKGMVGKSS